MTPHLLLRGSLAVLLFAGNVISGSGAAETVYSELWGRDGEGWSSGSRLPDFSHAGYHRGERPLPAVAVTVSVRDFGAVGDGAADDTPAIQAAIDAARNGAVWVPPGRYKITGRIWIRNSGVVLRGAGADRSVLWFPQGLDEVLPRRGHTSTGKRASGYSFDGAFVTITGDYRAAPIARIVADAERGDTSVTVDTPAGIAVGRNVLVKLHEALDHSLKTHLYCDDPGDIARGKKLDTKMLLRVTDVSGNRVRFDRPLRFAIREAWQPEILSFDPSVSESGVEGLGFEFPPRRYGGHFQETGANAIELREVHHCWVRDVTIRNADLGVNVVASGCTIRGVVITADAGRGTPDSGVAECTGHHAIQCKNAEDNLVTDFDLRTAYVHDLSVEHASGNVFSRGRGEDLNFDHHKDAPFENLFTEVDCGRGTRVWASGGGASIGRQCAGWGTFWNIRAAQPVSPPSPAWGPPTLIFVGLNSTKASQRDPEKVWFESLPPERLVPANLHTAQLERRLRPAQRLR